MRIVSFEHLGQYGVGLLTGDGAQVQALDIDASRGALALVEAIAAGQAMPPVRGQLPLAAVALLAPLHKPRRNLFCVGRNYHAHAKELRTSVFKDNTCAVDSWPIVFTKVPESVVGPGAAVRLPGAAISAQIDYEAELTLVIGKGGRNISLFNDREFALFFWPKPRKQYS